MKKAGLFLLLGFQLICAQSAVDSVLVYDNKVYESDFRSVQMLQTISRFNLPVIPLNSLNGLELSFDQLKSERDFFQYTLIHCNSNWEPSNIQKLMAIGGAGFESIDNAAPSFGTLMQYQHYVVTIPGNNVKPKISGNYLLVVYRNFDEKDIILSRRLMVYDQKISLQATIAQSSQVELRSTHQEVDFSFKVNDGYQIPNPNRDLRVFILQNANWSQAIEISKPQFVSGNKFDFNYQTGNQFWGINQYRFFDIRTLQLTSAGVKRKANIAGQKHVFLNNDQSRKSESYFNWADFNGRYLIFNRDNNFPDLPNVSSIESDYCFVHFALKCPEELTNKNVYIFGELSDWSCQEKFKLYYNADNKTYEAIVPLKQAYYNYIYVTEDKNTHKIDYTFFEGSHGVAENNYAFLIYHKNQTLGYDELIGYGLEAFKNN